MLFRVELMILLATCQLKLLSFSFFFLYHGYFVTLATSNLSVEAVVTFVCYFSFFFFFFF